MGKIKIKNEIGIHKYFLIGIFIIFVEAIVSTLFNNYCYSYIMKKYSNYSSEIRNSIYYDLFTSYFNSGYSTILNIVYILLFAIPIVYSYSLYYKNNTDNRSRFITFIIYSTGIFFAIILSAIIGLIISKIPH